MYTAAREEVPYQGPTIIDGSIEEHHVLPQTIHTPDCVHRGRTITRPAGPGVHIAPLPMPRADQGFQYDHIPTRQAGRGVHIAPLPMPRANHDFQYGQIPIRQAGPEVSIRPLPMGQASHDVQHGQTPLRQPGPDLYYTPTTTRQAALYMNSGPIPMAQAGQNIQYDQAPARPAIYGEPRYPTTKFDGLIFGTSMVSGDCHFCASIVSEPAEQEAIIQDLCRTFPDSDAAAIIKQGPFWVS